MRICALIQLIFCCLNPSEYSQQDVCLPMLNISNAQELPVMWNALKKDMAVYLRHVWKSKKARPTRRKPTCERGPVGK